MKIVLEVRGAEENNPKEVLESIRNAIDAVSEWEVAARAAEKEESEVKLLREALKVACQHLEDDSKDKQEVLEKVRAILEK